jgi:tRNA-specific 2-thiouridylase
MMDKMHELDADFVVTGHYARVVFEDGEYKLKKAVDESKDQSYFLYMLTQEQLKHIKFPLGEYTKPEIREIAEENDLITARKKDSQDICFVPDGDYAAFLERHTGAALTPGNFVLAESGQVLGRHRGMEAYTIGQRKGLGISWSEPLYVVDKCGADNSVRLGRNADLFRTELTAGDCNWIAVSAPEAGMRATARTRYHQTETPCTLYPLADGGVRAVFDSPIRAITPGQAVVFYQEDLVVGGGTIR